MEKQYKSMTEELIEKASKQKPKEEKKMENVQYILTDEAIKEKQIEIEEKIQQ